MGLVSCFLGTDVVGQVGPTAVRGRVSIIGDTVHLELTGRRHWDYDLRKIENNKIVALLPPLDSPTQVQLQTFRGLHLSAIEVNPEGPDGKTEVTFHLANPAIEVFDYLTDEPSRLIMDFYQPAEVVEKAQPASQKMAVSDSSISTQSVDPERVAAAAEALEKRLEAGEYELIEAEVTLEGDGSDGSGARSPAMVEVLSAEEDQDLLDFAIGGQRRGAFDGGDRDFSRFRVRDYEIDLDSVIASRQNIYIRFPMLAMPSSRLRQIAQHPPEYEVVPKETRENREARLLVALHQRQRFATFLRTYEYFIERYPQSDYDEIVRHLAAELHLNRWLKEGKREDYEKARRLYSYLVNRYPNSPLAERTELVLAYSALEMEDGLRALQLLGDFLKRHPESPDVDGVRRAKAEIHLSLNQYEEAQAQYESLIASAKSPRFAVEAQYRLGDVQFLQRNYPEAVAAYRKALSDHPEYEDIIPNVHFNMAEALFWQANYRNSLEHYIEFLKRFPAHQHGAYAMTRIGEILDILGVDTSRVMGAYLESHFRYRGHPGAELARIRMLSQRMMGMREQELNQALEEMLSIAERSPLPRASEFVTLLIADGFQSRQEHPKAMQYLINYYQQNPTTTNLDFFRRRIAAVFADAMQDLVQKGKHIEALRFHNQYSGTWLRNTSRTDIPFMVARAYELAGVYTVASEMYAKVLRELQQIQGTDLEREKRINEHLPTQQSLHLRLAAVDFEERQYHQASERLVKIGGGDQLTPLEQLERAQLSAQLAQKRGQTREAIANLEWVKEHWQGPSRQRLGIYLRLAELYVQENQNLESEKILDQMLSLADKESLGSVDDIARALRLRGDILFEDGKKMAALSSYTRLLEQFSEKKNLSDVRFRAGSILYDLGDFVGAERLWRPLDGKRDSLYRSLADERLQHARWSEEYQRYIERIPAMAQ